MKKLKLFLVVSVSIFCLGLTDNYPKHIKGKEFEGYVFPKEYVLEVSFENMKDKFTPNLHDINIVESTIKEQLHVLNRSKINQNKGLPLIDKNIRRYKRQYVGFIDKNGDRIVWINFICKKKISKDWNKKILIILDGGSYYWNLKVNLNQNKAFDLQVNGLG